MRKTAASQLARKEQLEAKVEALTRQRVELKDRGQDLDNETDEALGTALDALNEGLERARQDLAQADLDLKETLRHLKGPGSLQSQLDRAMLKRQVEELSQADPLAPSAEDIALANAREAIEDATALAKVMTEMSDEDREASPDPNERARAELERLKSERKTGKPDSSA